jgi:hypothetical protein
VKFLEVQVLVATRLVCNNKPEMTTLLARAVVATVRADVVLASLFFILVRLVEDELSSTGLCAKVRLPPWVVDFQLLQD